MPKIKYREVQFRADTLALVERCNAIIEEYADQGFTLTLRQLYYQLVARDLFPDNRRWRWTGTRWVRDPNGTKNALPNYKWLGVIVNDARLAGMIDWSAIEDRTRNLRSVAHWASPAEIISACARQFRHDKWKGQKYRPEVWIEKDALIGVIEGVCEELDVPYFSCRGYTSQSEMWGAAQRMLNYMQTAYLTTGIAGSLKSYQVPFIIHLGDHDPSGKDMSRDIEDRLNMFLSYHMKKRVAVGFKRIALNMDQVEQYEPPPNPAKLTDSRATGYIEEYGDESWELDALEPTVLAGLIRDQVEALRDQGAWEDAEAEEKEDREMLAAASEKWEDVEEMLK